MSGGSSISPASATAAMATSGMTGHHAAAAATSAMGGAAGSANSRKFSEKIKNLEMKQKEGTDEFEKLIAECARIRKGPVTTSNVSAY